MESLILYVGESTDLLKSLGGVETIAVTLQRRHFRALLIFRSKKYRFCPARCIANNYCK